MNLLFKNFLSKRRKSKYINSSNGISLSFGADFDKPDPQDQFKELKGENTKDKYSLAEFSHPARYQYRTSACVGFACTSAEFNVTKRAFEGISDEDLLLSANHNYYYARLLSGFEKEDAGSYIRDGLKALQKYGACLDENWSIKNNVLKRPPSFLYKRKIHAYKRLINRHDSPEEIVEKIMHCIAVEKLPIIISTKLYEHILKENRTESSGFIRTPSSKEILNRGLKTYGHAMYLDEFDFKKKTVSGMNSWSELWGNKGRFTIDFDYITNSLLVRDYWTFSYEYY